MASIKHTLSELGLTLMLAALALVLIPVLLWQMAKEWLLRTVDNDSAYLNWHNWNE